MKRLLSLLLIFALMVSFAGCSEEERILFSDVEWEKVVELGDYKGITVDTESETFEEFYNEVIEMDVENNTYYTEENLTEGKVQNGDVANIDYTGKKDGVAFQGGTATGHNLEIGSGEFIPGFEEGLIGAEIGKTVDLNLTFPKEYHSADLAGKAVVFTVKVNSVTRRIDQKPSEYFSKLGFKSVGEYNKDARKRAIENYLLDTIIANSKIKEYPETELKLVTDTRKKMYELQLQQYGVDFEGYLAAIGQTEENYINAQIKPMLEVQIVLYAILDKEKMTFTKEEVDEEINKSLTEIGDSSVTRDKLLDAYGEFYFEAAVVYDKVMDLIYKNAKLK